MKALNMGYELAEQAIKSYFAQTEHKDQEDREMMAYCQEKYSPIYAQRLAYRMMRIHINHIVVSSVLADLGQLQRDVIIRKYKYREMSAKISIALHLSINRITSVERAVQENINNMLKYILTVRDVYSRIKIANMIHIIDLRLSFLQEHPEIFPDVNRDWLMSLFICREKYRRLYSELEDVFRKATTSVHYLIIAAKIQNQSLTSKELSSICHVTQNGINRHLRTYEWDMSKYLIV